MYQIISKKWGLTPIGKPIRLAVLICDDDDDELPANLPIGSECTSKSGKTRVYFGDGEWVQVMDGSSVDDSQTSEDSCWSSAKTAEELDKKAYAVGHTPTLVAGGARTVVGNEAMNRLFRHSGACACDKIANGVAYVRKLCGNMNVLRQLLPSENATATVNGVTFTILADKRISVQTASGGATADAAFTVNSATAVSLIYNHKYLLRGCPEGGSASSYFMEDDVGQGHIFTAASSTTKSFTITVKSGTVIANAVVFSPQLYDLTAIFGSGKEPSVEDFKSLHPDYLPGYSAKMLPFGAEKFQTVGYNAYDGNAARVVKKNDVNNGYQIKGNFTAAYFSKSIDGDDWTELTADSYTTESGRTVTRIQPPDDGYVSLTGADSLTAICLIGDGRRAAEQVGSHTECTVAWPVKKYFAGGMMSLGTTRDEMTEKRAVSRIGVVDLGTVDWIALSGCKYYTDGLKLFAAGANSGGKIESDYVPTISHNSFINTDKPTCALTNDGRVWFYDTQGFSASQFKSFIAGHKLYYVRKSPAVTEIDEHLEFAYPVEDLGTEEFLYDGPSSAGYMEICYGIDVALILANLHPDFINAASMYAFLTELLTQTGIEVDMYDDGDEYAFDVSAGERLLPECTASDAGKTVKVNSSGTGYVLV